MAESSTRHRTGFQVADEDVPVLELGDDASARRDDSGPDGRAGEEAGHGSGSGDAPKSILIGAAGGRAGTRVPKRDSTSSGTGSLGSNRSVRRVPERGRSFSLRREYDEERLEEVLAQGDGGQHGSATVHVAELLVGVVANMNEFSDPSDYSNSSIFESFFDLTHARLLHIFQMFDDLSVDKASGILDYENFRRGLRDAGLDVKDKASFERLVHKVDLDRDGGISFNEFEAVVQSLKMAQMFRAHRWAVEPHFCCVNYNVQRAEEQVVDWNHFKGFMYSPRPEWATHRWVELSLPANATLKCLAIKYRLHPLALEDALKDSGRARAKVERFDTHLFVVFPVLTLVYDDVWEKTSGSGVVRRSLSRSGSFRSASSIARLQKYGSSVREPLIRGSSGGKAHATSSGSPSYGSTESAPAAGERPACASTPDEVRVPHVVKLNAYVFVSLADNYRTTISAVSGECRHLFQRVHRELGVSYSRLRQHDGMYLLYTMLDVIVDSYQPLVGELEELLERLSEQVRSHRAVVVTGDAERSFSAAYHDLIREANNLKRWMLPAQRVVSNLIANEELAPDCKLYLRDVHDHLEQTSDDIASLLSGLHTLKEEYDHAIEVKMNGTMHVLTVVATVALPGQFLSSVFGMNFEDMPELHWRFGYPLFWVLTFCSWAALFQFFRVKGHL